MPTPSALPFAFVGVVHLLPLPGGPVASPGFGPVFARALADARALVDGGVDGLIIENFGDAPFLPGSVEPHVVAITSVIANEVRRFGPEPLIGINLLRNDALAALGVAAAVGADFIRVNVHIGAMLTDQGLIQGQAGQTLRYRQALGAQVQIAADVLVKHAVPLGDPSPGAVASDTARRGLADVLIVTGEGTGRPADPDRLEQVCAAVPECPVWVGSGVTIETASMWRSVARGAIVGTALHSDGQILAPVDVRRVAAMARALGR